MSNWNCVVCFVFLMAFTTGLTTFFFSLMNGFRKGSSGICLVHQKYYQVIVNLLVISTLY